MRKHAESKAGMVTPQELSVFLSGCHMGTVRSTLCDRLKALSAELMTTTPALTIVRWRLSMTD
jgi:hypothetical protein